MTDMTQKPPPRSKIWAQHPVSRVFVFPLRGEMNDLLYLLTGGDLRSDGRADEVAEKVLTSPVLFDALWAGLDEPDDVVRARTAHALEKVSRRHPEWLAPGLSKLIGLAQNDPVPMVRWHLAMIFGNLAVIPEEVDRLVPVLLDMLKEESVFVLSWTIVSLAVIGRIYPEYRETILATIKTLHDHDSKAIRSKVFKAKAILAGEASLPAGWVKSAQWLG